jgi:ATP-dependent protease ClpP protease subunit
MLKLHCCQQMQSMKLLLNQLAMSQAASAGSGLLTSGTPAHV